MNRSEALTLLETAIRDDSPSRMNPSLTRAQAVGIVERGIAALTPVGDILLPHIFEKRVWQVCDKQREVDEVEFEGGWHKPGRYPLSFILYKTDVDAPITGIFKFIRFPDELGNPFFTGCLNDIFYLKEVDEMPVGTLCLWKGEFIQHKNGKYKFHGKLSVIVDLGGSFE